MNLAINCPFQGVFFHFYEDFGGDKYITLNILDIMFNVGYNSNI